MTELSELPPPTGRWRELTFTEFVEGSRSGVIRGKMLRLLGGNDKHYTNIYDTPESALEAFGLLEVMNLKSPQIQVYEP